MSEFEDIANTEFDEQLEHVDLGKLYVVSLARLHVVQSGACLCGNYLRAGFISFSMSVGADTIQGRELLKGGK